MVDIPQPMMGKKGQYHYKRTNDLKILSNAT